MKSITAEELQIKVEQGEQLQILDVREDAEVAYGMVPDAIHIPLGELPERVAELDPQQPVYVICKAGGRSAMACDFLATNDLETINIEGGMMEWEGETIA